MVPDVAAKQFSDGKAGKVVQIPLSRIIAHKEDTPIREWTWDDVIWVKVVYFIILHIAAVYGLVKLVTGFRGGIHSHTIKLVFVFYFMGAFGVTAGVHRYWSHRSYEAAWPFKMLLTFFFTIANQGSIWHWCRDHVVHHKYSETIADPHDARRGFFFAHIGWLLVKKQPEVITAGNSFQLAWLKNDPFVWWQHKYYSCLSVLCCFVLPTLIAATWGDASGGLWLGGFGTHVFGLHCTWLVNSAAHLWGKHPYDPKINPAENPFVALLSVGEGWHNWHHTFPQDYAASEYGMSFCYNPTKLFLDACAKLGLVYNRKRVVISHNVKSEMHKH